jgi:hypothetical protein
MSIRNGIEMLRYVGNGGMPEDTCRGLCGNLLDRGITTDIEPMLKKWPEYSGSPAYPIRDGFIEPADSYGYDMYSSCSEYGRARRRLALFLADELEALL